ncbi:hypothetical protein [Acrocarpospora sp. B8E8]|uniref:hypothetical protein n=1 Tax=Acrocarpospora sp. B8E8 TaxID=3153572 RepID=UPI00325EB289
MHIDLPIHPYTRLQAIGVLPSGRVIWPVMGGSGEGDGGGETGGTETETGTGGADTSTTTDTGTGPADQGGTATDGKPETGKAKDGDDELAKWRALSKQNEDRAKENKKALDAATKKNQDTFDAIAQALGLKKGEQVDPAKQIELLTGDLGKTQADLRSARVELAVYKAAGKNGGDADALLDSRGFLNAVAELDPAEKDFTAAVAEAIKTAVKDNPKLAATQPTPPAKKSGSDGMNGAAGTGPRKPVGLAGAIKAHYNT